MKAFLAAFLILPSFAFALTLGTYNIRNFDYDTRARISTDKSTLATLLKSMHADVISVQEIVNTAEFERFIAKSLPGFDAEISRCGGEHDQHLGFVFNKNVVSLLSFNEDLAIADPGKAGGCNAGSRPMAIALFQVKATGQKFYGISLHLKSGGTPSSIQKRLKQYEVIKNTITQLKAKTGVKDFYFAGDLNSTEYTTRGVDYKALTAMVSALGMVDLAQNMGCSAYWWGGTEDGIESPSLLDHVVVTPGLLKKAARAEVMGHCQKVSCKPATPANLGLSYGGVSDHCPIRATIQ